MLIAQHGSQESISMPDTLETMLAFLTLKDVRGDRHCEGISFPAESHLPGTAFLTM